MTGIGLGVIVIGVFLVVFLFTFSLRHAFNATVWFSVAWMLSLLLLYVLDAFGFGFISTEPSPTGRAGGAGLIVAFLVTWIYHRRWRKKQAEKKAREEAERARRRAAGEPEPTRLGNVFRAIGKSWGAYRK